jgi:hypothetical protein
LTLARLDPFIEIFAIQEDAAVALDGGQFAGGNQVLYRLLGAAQIGRVRVFV